VSQRPRSLGPFSPWRMPAAGASRRRDRVVQLWCPGRTPAGRPRTQGSTSVLTLTDPWVHPEHPSVRADSGLVGLSPYDPLRWRSSAGNRRSPAGNLGPGCPWDRVRPATVTRGSLRSAVPSTRAKFKIDHVWVPAPVFTHRTSRVHRVTDCTVPIVEVATGPVRT
jgi:hypothetical protein